MRFADSRPGRHFVRDLALRPRRAPSRAPQEHRTLEVSIWKSIYQSHEATVENYEAGVESYDPTSDLSLSSNGKSK